jgi:hypothetical protein
LPSGSVGSTFTTKLSNGLEFCCRSFAFASEAALTAYADSSNSLLERESPQRIAASAVEMFAAAASIILSPNT